jgi:multidrug efflux system outer membrane protein
MAPMKTTLLSLAVAAALAGCAGLSKESPVAADFGVLPGLAPAPSASAQANLSIERWWILFGDPALERLMDEALARNEDLESALARVREAQASLDVAGAAQSPTVDLQVKNGRSQSSEVGATPLPRSVARESSSHKVSLEAAYEVDLWGRLSSSTAAARKQLLATEWARASVEWSLTARLAESYYGLAAVDRQIEISQAVRAVRLETVLLRQREFAAGAGIEFDLRRAEAELTGTDATLASLDRQRIALERALTALLGRTPAEIAQLGLHRGRLDENRAFQAVLPQGDTAGYLVRRPDLRQAEAQLAAANHSIDAARAATLPAVRLSGAIGSDAKSMADLFSGPAAIWSLGASVTQSIVDGGKAKARVKEEQARAQQSLANYRKVVSGALLELKESYESLDITQRAFQAERDRVAALERARELARRGHVHGAVSTLDLLDAERNWHQAQLQQVGAQRDRIVAQVSAFKALGGGFAQTRSSL